MKLCYSIYMRYLILILLIFSIPIFAFSQTAPQYLLDGSNVIWFVQITDTHVDSDALKYYKDYFMWVLNEAVPVINPFFIVVTGDLTDSTKSTFPYYGSGPHEEEWLKYKNLYLNAMMTPSFYYDVPGNHDAYGDGQLAYYLKYSLQGSFTNSTQQSWYIDNGRAIYHFFSAATPANDGKQWPSDNQEFTDEELIQIDRFLKEKKDADMRIVFGHHDYEKEDVKNKDRFLILLKDYGVSYYGHGHEHDYGFRIGDGKIIKYRLDSLGQSEGNNVAVWAIDNFGVTIKTYKAMSMFPAAIITAPADVILDDPKSKIENPYIPPVSRNCTNAPVRALVFSKADNPDVSFSIDSDPEIKMVRRENNPQQYRGYFDATGLSVGLHSITVRVVTDSSARTTNEFYVADIPCELGKEDPDEIIDVDAGYEIDTHYEDINGTDEIVIVDQGYEDVLETEDSIDDIQDSVEDLYVIADEVQDIEKVNDTMLNDKGTINDLIISKPDSGFQDELQDSGCSCNLLF